MKDSPSTASASDAVRYLYLARVAEREGHAEAAQRWQEMAAGWMTRLEPNMARRKASPSDAS